MKKYVTFLLFTLLISGLVFAEPIDSSSSVDSSFANPTSLTDKEMDNAQNFTHQGIKDRAMEEGCAKLNNCSAEDDGLPLEEMIGKAYTLIGMLSSGGLAPTLTSRSSTPATPAADAADVSAEASTAGATPPGAEAEPETQPDYCMMVAMGWEAVAGMIQTDLQGRAESSAPGEDIQLQSLVRLKETHKARAKTATIQGTVYGTVAACYVAQLFNNAKPDWKWAMKFGGATALSVLYIKKVDKHKDAAEVVQQVIDSLPKTGDCNPWTGTTCFCSERTSQERYPMEYQEVCVLNAGNFDVPKIALGCGAVVDNKLQYDKECKCKKTNSCLRSNLKVYNPKFPFGNNMMNEVNKNFDLLNSGEFDEGKLAAASTKATTLASRVKPKIEGKIPPQPKLTAEQKKMADSLKSVLPPALATVAAASNGSYKGGVSDSSGGTSALSKLPPQLKDKLATALKVNYKRGSGPRKRSSDGPQFTMPKFPGEESGSNSTEILSFAEQAISKADVSNAPSTPIFDIISNRYRRSGWKKLEAKTETETVEK